MKWITRSGQIATVWLLKAPFRGFCFLVETVKAVYYARDDGSASSNDPEDTIEQRIL